VEFLFVLLHVALIWILAVATPGANVLLTINTALTYDRKVAFFSALGVSIATLFWAFLGGSGLVILFSHFPQLSDLVKVIGGSYLCYLGIRQIYLTRKLNRLRELAGSNLSVSPSKKKVFLRAFITSILNPKTGFFVVSLFGVSMPENITTVMLLAIMLTMSSITLCWHLFLAITFSHNKAKCIYGRISGVMDYITGGLFTLYGVKVMVS